MEKASSVVVLAFLGALARGGGANDRGSSAGGRRVGEPCDTAAAVRVYSLMSTPEMGHVVHQGSVIVLQFGSDYPVWTSEQRAKLAEAFANADACISGAARTIRFLAPDGASVGRADSLNGITMLSDAEIAANSGSATAAPADAPTDAAAESTLLQSRTQHHDDRRSSLRRSTVPARTKRDTEAAPAEHERARNTRAVVEDNQIYFDFQVDKPAAAAEGNPQPTYPEALRSSGVEGKVDAQFVVDVNGRADMSTFKVLKATNDLFAASVRNALPHTKFHPGEVGGHKVRQVVQQSFMFSGSL